MKKTRAIQILDRSGVPYEVRTFESDGFTPALEAARELTIPPAAMFKTIVARGERRGVVLAMVPSDHTLSLRKLAQLMGDKRAGLVDASDLLRLTGYVKGGVSPLGGKRSYPAFIDRSALQHERISVSAGMRGVVVLVAPSDLIRLTGASVSDLLE